MTKMTRAQRLERIRQAYESTFCGELAEPHPNAQIVLADLRRVCGITRGGIVVNPKSGAVDPYATIYRAAMRDVYLRIVGFLSLDDKTLFQEPSYDHTHSEPDPKPVADSDP